MANSVDPDQMLHSAASDQGLHCLQRTIYLNTKGCYGTNYRIEFHICRFYRCALWQITYQT